MKDNTQHSFRDTGRGDAQCTRCGAINCSTRGEYPCSGRWTSRPETKLGFNVGSGQRRFLSTPEIFWVNVDSVSRPGHEPDRVADGANLQMFGDESADYYVLHHVLEHFGCGEASGLIKEAYRVLKPGGSLQVFVPNLRALAERWLAGQLDTQLYVTNLYGAYMGDEADRHRWGFDAMSLDRFLQECPWAFTHFRCSTIPGADCAHDWWILEMECVK